MGSQEKALFGILTQQNMLGKALDLCLYILSTSPRKPIVQECSLIALARTVAQIPSVEPMVRTQIAANFHEWLKTTNEKVLTVVVQSIRLLVNGRICFDELLSKDMVKTLVSILFTHKEHQLITTACCEILAMVSFEPCTHDVLATANELQILYHIGKMNDNEYLKIMVCTVLCNVASTMERALIENGVIFEFSMLSANSAHNEIIQELIARAI